MLIVDNLSPFTPDIDRCLSKLGVDHSRVAYSDVLGVDLAQYRSVILSGRRRNSREINHANSKIIIQCVNSGKPLFGICYGAEIIALSLGGSIRRMSSHIQGHITVSIHARNNLTGEKNSLGVYESHAFCIARLPPDFISLARSESCEYEIIAHKDKPIFGTQFHPEKSGPDGLGLLRGFADIRHEGFYLQSRKS